MTCANALHRLAALRADSRCHVYPLVYPPALGPGVDSPWRVDASRRRDLRLKVGPSVHRSRMFTCVLSLEYGRSAARATARQRRPVRVRPGIHPVRETGKTFSRSTSLLTVCLPQWSLVRRTGKTAALMTAPMASCAAAMEPGQEDREDTPCTCRLIRGSMPQWSPVREDREDGSGVDGEADAVEAAMEPGQEDREDEAAFGRPAPLPTAAMEPGQEDREDRLLGRAQPHADRAAMEPGQEDREDHSGPHGGAAGGPAAMEPGQEDREDRPGHLGGHDPTRVPQWSPVRKTGKTG